MTRAFTVLTLLAAIPLATTALADDSTLTAEQLAAKFIAQQATRGLVIAPSGDAAANAATGAAAQPEDTTYVALAPSAQVNFEIKFAFDSAALESTEVDKLDTLCEVLRTSDIPLFKIIGHTDASGSDSYNKNLSLLRAQEVKRYLVEDCGVPDSKLVATGMGEAFLLDPTDPRSEVNRRVEFQAGS